LSTAVLAYTRLIQASGSVVAVAVSTLRKVVTVTLSYIVFPKQLLTIHVVSGVAVLGGIVLSSYSSKQGRTSRK
jgi:solute carrier family 35 (adenosine 3'-phospho 5'-phosphosulfate transporter), member B3